MAARFAGNHRYARERRRAVGSRQSRCCAPGTWAVGPNLLLECIRTSGAWICVHCYRSLVHVNADRALRELETPFAAQWLDGRVPHIASSTANATAADYFPNPGWAGQPALLAAGT